MGNSHGDYGKCNALGIGDRGNWVHRRPGWSSLYISRILFKIFIIILDPLQVPVAVQGVLLSPLLLPRILKVDLIMDTN